ncbi:hypothetical protein ASPNIDRAFT_36797 [Aspergillus niger ATCC 1015]|uniref:Uncharacterized protein n=1 Tax=Aspergillus niger (strain ATCC 1015 / CBS 113.46 / FGSC A1144 / LSHB Ac4 / NCTC 3858a / NRRL 328 / USDA 3528.7) TaxID=380704 RepID=G3Y296_ASPNA|nr:hypothetical protein ASPNIDRAFT_36797 [Aspergillus niger ATCC 1015]
MYGGFPIWRSGPLCSIFMACCYYRKADADFVMTLYPVTAPGRAQKKKKRKKKSVDSSETEELRHCSPSFSWLTASCCPNCSGGDTLAAAAADSLIGNSHQNNSKKIDCLAYCPRGGSDRESFIRRKKGYVAAMAVVFRRCPHFELGLVVVVVSVAAVHIGNPGLNSLVALLGRIRNWTALVNLVGVPTMREIWRWAGEN